MELSHKAAEKLPRAFILKDDFMSDMSKHLTSLMQPENPSEINGYTHCLMRGPMSLPETLEMDLRKA